ncbi:uncharacterized protein [Paramormyrops kingsleyae]|uniref:uncharacterized protein isoform X2 n=1 Tax=Paramormyrops kingsleyae TaxID=1676925 RepID=UPI000CD5F7E9|nr:uncharacterized protein LOC111852507 isoform X2 [Paramormyrops kingsleyae]
MAISAFQLPQEVWFHVFRFLQPHEKGNIRSTCKFFKVVIDHPALWRKHTVVLKNIRSYDSQFWATLRRRRTTSVVVHKAGVKEWERLATALPFLTSLTIVQCSDPKTLCTIERFKDLRRLAIRSFQCPPGLAGVLASLGHLTNLCLCELSGAPGADLIGAVSKLSNLTTLLYHESDKPIPKKAFHTMLSSLPHLKHLSLKMGVLYGTLPGDYFILPKVNRDPNGEPCGSEFGLAKLELLSYMDPILPPAGLDGLQCLQSLTIEYRDRAVESDRCHLKTWLSKLPCLTELTVTRGYPLNVYARVIPRTLTSLSLPLVFLSLRDMQVVARQAPGLQHLHTDLWSSDGHACLRELPRLFCQLRTLSLRDLNVTEMDFLGLARLRYLEKLVLLDPNPGPSLELLGLIREFRERTNHGVQVVHSLPRGDPAACCCYLY